MNTLSATSSSTPIQNQRGSSVSGRNCQRASSTSTPTSIPDKPAYHSIAGSRTYSAIEITAGARRKNQRASRGATHSSQIPPPAKMTASSNRWLPEK